MSDLKAVLEEQATAAAAAAAGATAKAPSSE